jgi:N-acetylmuramoyl-L-alanine amidase
MRAAWLVSLKLKAVLLKRGYQVVMTKSSEREMVRNKRRAEIANKAQASLLLRIHCDAASETGFSTYYPAKVGSADGIRGPSEQVIKLSKAAAGPFHKAVIKALGGSIGDRGLRTDAQTAVGAKHGGALIGSVYSKVPVLLVEMCVITQAKDETFIKTPKGQQKMAEALAAGVEAAVPVQ